jgi:putative ABC transport system permease protein
MFYFYKTTLRKITKQKSTSLINLAGLVLGISTFLFITAWIRSEKSFDRFWKGYDRIYRVALTKTANGSPIHKTAMNYPGAGRVLENEFPEIEVVTTFGKDVITVFTPETSYQDIRFYYIDTSFFTVFPRPVVSETSNIFADIHGAIISKSMAKKLFGKANPLNMKFKLNEGWEFFVSAVFEDMPENSHLKVDMMIQWKSLFYYMNNFNYETGVLNNDHISEMTQNTPYSQSEWSPLYSCTYIKLKPGNNSIASLESKYKSAILPCIKHIREAGEDVEFNFQPLSAIHLFSKLNDELSVNGSNFRINAFGIIALLIIIISWFNYINLSIAAQMKQAAKEQVKRLIGAGKGHLFMQQVMESFTIHAVAGIVSLSLIIVVLRHGVQSTGFNIYSLNYLEISAICIALVCTGTFISAIYPFIKIMRMKPENMLKKVGQSGPVRVFSRQAMVIMQFGIAILLIICTSMVFKQIWFMQKQDLGVQLNQIMVSYSPMTMIKKPALEPKLKAFKDEVTRIPGVVSFTTTETVPGKNFRRTSNDVHLEEAPENKYLFSLANVEYNYFEFFSIKMMAGTEFKSESEYNGTNVIINEMARKRLGIPDNTTAIDRMVQINNRSYRIIGVVNDYHHLSLKDEITPAIFFKSLQWYFDIGYYCIKVSPHNLESTIQSINNTWSEFYPDEPYLYSFLDDSFNALYKEDKAFGSTYLFFSIIAIFIAGMGLFALARISAENKTKEIGIRRVNGASYMNILAMLNKDYIKWVIIAYILACPFAWYVIHQWLQNFAYKTGLSWWIFTATGIVAILIALITVSWQSWRTATRNPVEALRYE